MEVLALEDSGFGFRVELADARDIDVEAVAHVDPACVDDVLALAAVSLPGVRVDVEQVLTQGLVVFGGVMADCVVEVVGHAVKGGCVDLGVNVPVPGEHL